jgi:hypothetical protein
MSRGFCETWDKWTRPSGDLTTTARVGAGDPLAQVSASSLRAPQFLGDTPLPALRFIWMVEVRIRVRLQFLCPP